MFVCLGIVSFFAFNRTLLATKNTEYT
uniref:Uncharacterized protein n=1 Tax=Anguilla anguilla TaxID=7936 RepID=A0A0E9RBI5_ANGAN